MKSFHSLLIFCALALCAPPLAAQPAPAGDKANAAAPVERRIPETLMFSIDEINEIQSRAAAVNEDKDKSKASADTIENATLYLSTILYSGPSDWTIWVNGKPIGPRQEFNAFEIKDIGSNFVELLVPLSALGMRPVRLAPNQTFIAKSGLVVEGQWR